jgi:3-hydroxyisobutyrate dehydrogenase
MSSGVPAATIRLAQRLDAAGVQLVDAPVSGGVPRARTGELAIMAGGTERDLERAAPILSAMGNRILRTGAVGSAHAMKALNNMVSAAGFLAAAEALLVGSRFGLDPGVIVDVLNASTGMNNSTQKKLRQFVLSGSFDSGFGLDLMLKDLGIARDLAGDTGAAAPLSSACHQLWQAARNILGPGHDHTEMARVSQLLAGATVLPARA